jgi:pimeloyl-ACP methyl ester carboxylesterase
MIVRIIYFLIAAASLLPDTQTAFAQLDSKNLPPGHRSVLAGTVPIVYTDQGEGEPLLILTPYRFSTAIWSDLASRLSGSMRVIVIEPPGLRNPDSMNRDFSDIHLLEIYRDFVKALGLSQVHVMGVGESGMEAAGFGHHWPNFTKSVISINGLEVANWTDPVQSMLDVLKQAGSGKESKLASALSVLWHEKPLSREDTDRLFVPFRFGTRGAFEMRLEAYRSSLQSGFVPAMMRQLNKPILLIRSKEDQFITEDNFGRARHVIRASVFQYEIVPDAGHFAFVDQPDRVAELIRAFVGRNTQYKID